MGCDPLYEKKKRLIVNYVIDHVVIFLSELNSMKIPDDQSGNRNFGFI